MDQWNVCFSGNPGFLYRRRDYGGICVNRDDLSAFAWKKDEQAEEMFLSDLQFGAYWSGWTAAHRNLSLSFCVSGLGSDHLCLFFDVSESGLLHGSFDLGV